MEQTRRVGALRFLLLIKTVFCFGVWGLPALLGPPPLLGLFGITVPPDPFYLRVLGGLVVAVGVIYWLGYKDPIRNVAVVVFGIVDNAVATAVLLYCGLTTGMPSWFFWVSSAFTALFTVAFVMLFPRGAWREHVSPEG